MKNTLMLRSIMIAATVALLSSSPFACAGSASGKVLNVTATRSVLWAFSVGGIVGRAACGASNEFAIDNNSAGGKAMIATVLAAQAQGLTLNVMGTGNCDVWGDRESAATVWATP
jgi:hypothetical protein